MVGYNAKDGHAVPAMAQPLPGSILAFSPQGAWGDAPVCVHQGIHGFYQAHSVGTGIPFARTLLELGMSRWGLLKLHGHDGALWPGL